MYESPKLWPVMLYSLIGAAALFVSKTAEGAAWQAAAGFVLLISVICVGVVLYRFIGYYGVEFYDQYRVAASKTKASLLAEKIRDLTREQLLVVKAQGELGLLIQPTAEGPRAYIQGTTVPLDFVLEEYLQYCLTDNTSSPPTIYLPPIRTWSEGHEWYDYGDRRDLASQFTDHLVHLGWAAWGAGNERARLTGKRDVAYLRKALTGRVAVLGRPLPVPIADEESAEESDEEI